MSKLVLGRGLGALMNKQNPTANSREAVHKVAIEKIFSSPLQPRKVFPEAELQQLADSIRQQGILQPLVVREVDGKYELIAGERRLRAAKIADLKEVPIITVEADDKTALELMLVENLQRENLNPIDEAQGFDRLMKEFGLTQEEVAEKVGRTRIVVTHALSLLKNLPLSVQALVASGRITAGHARALMPLEYHDEIQMVAEIVIQRGFSVRQTEAFVAARKASEQKIEAPVLQSVYPVKEIEKQLYERFQTKVKLKANAKGKGILKLPFANKEELDRILDILSVKLDL